MPSSFSTPLRVLYICHDGDMYGSQQSLALLLEHLPKDQIQPFVSIARSGPLNERLAKIPGVTLLHHRRLQWIKHDPRGPGKKLGDTVSLLAGGPGKVAGLCRLIKEHNIQLVHSNSVVSLEGALAARRMNIPHIWHIRELFMEKTPKLQPVLGRSLTLSLVESLSKVVICISKAVQAQFEPEASLNPRKYPVIYNALPPHLPHRDEIHTDLHLPPRMGKYRLGYIGRLSEGKRFHDLLEAMYLLNTVHPDAVDLIVAGNFVDTPYETYIKQQVQRLGLAHQVHFLGYQPNLVPLYQAMDVLVVPSLNEPFGRVVIEAAQAGVPCIAADSGGIPEIIDHGVNGLLFPPKTPQVLADTLIEALDADDLLSTLAENARRMVPERFTIETHVHAILACYHGVFEAMPLAKGTPFHV